MLAYAEQDASVEGLREKLRGQLGAGSSRAGAAGGEGRAKRQKGARADEFDDGTLGEDGESLLNGADL